MYLLGNISIYLGLALSIYSLIVLVLGVIKQNQRLINSGKGAAISVFISMATATAVMLYFLGTSNFQIEYVRDYTSSELPMGYKLSALWAGNSGSLMLWNLFLTMYIVMIVFSRKLKGTPFIPYVTAILMGNAVFFYFVLGFVAKPFVLLETAPAEGHGLNPMLQNPGMLIHPVTLYLGYVGLAVPFAFAMAALIIKNMDDFWIKITRRWTIIAWLFLSLGNILGAQWAYVELGWGGYWAWDPVENASFMPWLTATAYLHSVMIQERKNMLKVWNIALIITSYALTLFGTFLVRSGVLTSVHAFANSSLGTWFLVYMTIALLGGLYVVFSRYHLIKRDAGQFQSYLSKESSFLFNNLILVGSAFAVFWGTIFPIVSEAIKGKKVTVGIPFFNTVQAPLLLSLIFIMAVCPLIAWQRSSGKNLVKNFLIPALVSLGIAILLFILEVTKPWALISYTVVAFMILTHVSEFIKGTRARMKMTGEMIPVALYRLAVRNRRRYGGYIVHFGIALIALGIIGSQNYETEIMKTVSQGEVIRINNYAITYEKLDQKSEGINDIIYADLSIQHAGKPIGIFEPEKVFYGNWDQPSTEVSLYSTWKEDLYITLNNWEDDGRATFHIKVIPGMQLMWTGSILLVIGTLFAIWSGKFGNITPRYTGNQKDVF
ncbi:MAG: cytochrome c assembly protein [Bacillales bacterium]|jgi:cytochrome c-type biogenesis protein CcmF|nr:cytochrome c assembly protein [Bacillales bacterium]